MTDDLQCVECGLSEERVLVFVKTIKYEDGTIKELPEGMHPHCAPCRKKLSIFDELNPGRDLRAEAKQALLAAVEEARQVVVNGGKRIRGLGVIMDAVDTWAGGMDGLHRMLGRRVPSRPSEVFDGVSDALGEIDSSTMTASQAIGLITATNMISDHIPNWDDFVQRTYEHFKKTMGKERARKNLVGFI